VTIRVLYNRNIDGMLWGARPLHLFDVVHEPGYTDTEPLRICERAFADMQDAPAHQLGLRSMSVGDIVQVDDRSYACQAIGFQLIDWVPRVKEKK
jgi:hypothetical protein